jgi:hypothetical protein
VRLTLRGVMRLADRLSDRALEKEEERERGRERRTGRTVPLWTVLVLAELVLLILAWCLGFYMGAYRPW